MKSLYNLGSKKSLEIFLICFLFSNFVYAQNERDKKDELGAVDSYARNLIQVDPIENEKIQVTPESTLTPEKVETSDFDKLGITYFLFFNGPGITQETHSVPPNEIGRPDFTGLNSFNAISFRYKITEKYNIDLQTRTRVVFNNGTDTNNFKWFIWESPRIGVSGKLLKGEFWNLTGAVNSDFPYSLPEPFTGYTARERTVLFNPGMFANYNYHNPASDWSYSILLTPRYFHYKDDNKLEKEGVAAGFTGQNKPHLVIALSPSVNYIVSDKLSWSGTTTIEYIKQVGSDWDPTSMTLISNSKTSDWVLNGIPFMFGPKYSHTKDLTIYPFIQFFPITKQRESAKTGLTAAFEDTVSFGMWISGSFK
ncbi:MAG: hypothetical protein QE271_08555 [Bacteriovoracaceae bacterium]|nr:hypothetical protein [Bacteriovoracaceae bacterium]